MHSKMPPTRLSLQNKKCALAPCSRGRNWSSRCCFACVRPNDAPINYLRKGPRKLDAAYFALQCKVGVDDYIRAARPMPPLFSTCTKSLIRGGGLPYCRFSSLLDVSDALWFFDYQIITVWLHIQERFKSFSIAVIACPLFFVSFEPTFELVRILFAFPMIAALTKFWLYKQVKNFIRILSN